MERFVLFNDEFDNSNIFSNLSDVAWTSLSVCIISGVVVSLHAAFVLFNVNVKPENFEGGS